MLYGGGCAFLCLGALFAILALCIPQLSSKRLSVLTGYVQTMAGERQLLCKAFTWEVSLSYFTCRVSFWGSMGRSIGSRIVGGGSET